MMTAGMDPPGESERSRLGGLYESFAPGGLRLAYLLTGDRTVAEDIVQEAFIRFVGRLQHLRDPGLADAYLRRTVVNLAKNHFRRRSLERRFLQREAMEPRQDVVEPDPLSYESMRTALLALPVRQRAAIVLRYYEDLPDSDIADMLRCRSATVRSLVSRGLETLRRNPEVIT